MSYSYRTSKASPYARNKRHGGGRTQTKRKSRGSYIDPSRFVATATITQKTVYEPTHSFSDLDLVELLKQNLRARGYEIPSPIQDQAIPAGLAGKDIIGIASTGTGKTAAFALPVLHKLITDKHAAAIIIAPTRELAQQIQEECRSYARTSGLKAALLIGGTSMGAQLRDLRDRPRVVIGTPGRIKDHLQRGSLTLNQFNIVVLDEVDRMLDMGFVNDVTTILKQTSPNRQSFFFSATMSPKIRSLIDTFTNDPLTVSVEESSASENVHQDVVRYRDESEKIDHLHNLLIKSEVAKAIVFDERQRDVEKLSKRLQERGFVTDAIHGGKTQGQRQRALAKFKGNEITILIATDVAARGIDVADITHVINYSVPKEYDDYIHRIGRAGRAGKIGYAFTFIEHQS